MNSAKFTVTFQELNAGFMLNFGEVQPVSDGGYERGYADGVASVPDYLAMRVSNSLTEYANDNLTTIADYAFYYCSKLERVDFPNCTHVGSYAFQYCSALKEVNFPLAASVGSTYSYSFSRCTKLEKADFGCVESIGGYAFQLCNALKTLIIRTPTVCTLQGVSAINSSAINSGKGYIYVPAALVEQYKAAANWSTYAAQIRAVEDYPEITGGGS